MWHRKMGIPGLYGWLLRSPEFKDGHRGVHDSLSCENLYLDMNGIIHPCCHSDNSVEAYAEQDVPEEEMFQRIRQQVIDLVELARPTNVLFLSVDGVAPRAKMNQQRSRRLINAQQAIHRASCDEQLRAERLEMGLENPPPARNSVWDHNQIAPGTDFMKRLNLNLREFVEEQLASNPSWKGLTVIQSDSSGKSNLLKDEVW